MLRFPTGTPPDLSVIVKARGYERGFPGFVIDMFTQYQEHGADYLVVQPDELRAKQASPRWKRMAPFTGLVTKELQTGKHRADWAFGVAGSPSASRQSNSSG